MVKVPFLMLLVFCLTAGPLQIRSPPLSPSVVNIFFSPLNLLLPVLYRWGSYSEEATIQLGFLRRIGKSGPIFLRPHFIWYLVCPLYFPCSSPVLHFKIFPCLLMSMFMTHKYQYSVCTMLLDSSSNQSSDYLSKVISFL